MAARKPQRAAPVPVAAAGAAAPGLATAGMVAVLPRDSERGRLRDVLVPVAFVTVAGVALLLFLWLK